MATSSAYESAPKNATTPPMSHPQSTAEAEGVVSRRIPVVVKTPVPTMLATTIIVAENAPMTRFGCPPVCASAFSPAFCASLRLISTHHLLSQFKRPQNPRRSNRKIPGVQEFALMPPFFCQKTVSFLCVVGGKRPPNVAISASPQYAPPPSVPPRHGAFGYAWKKCVFVFAASANK